MYLKKSLLITLTLFFSLSIMPNIFSYDKIGKNSKGYYYQKSKSYKNKNPLRKSVQYYYIYDHDYYPAYSYTYPGYRYYNVYPYYYHNDQGIIWSMWSN